MTEIEKCEWQLVGEGDWIFGEKIRGIVRVYHGRISFCNQVNIKCGWYWWLLGEGMRIALALGHPVRGVTSRRAEAIGEVEKALGIFPLRPAFVADDYAI